MEKPTATILMVDDLSNSGLFEVQLKAEVYATFGRCAESWREICAANGE